MAFNPIKMYQLNGNFVAREISFSGQITLNAAAGDRFLVAYNAASMGIYGAGKMPHIGITVHSPAAIACVYWDNYKLDKEVSVGDKFTTTWKGGGGRSFYNSWDGSGDVRPTGKTIYFILSGSGSETFIFSGLALELRETITYPFGISSSFAGGYRSPGETNSFEITSTYYSDAITQYEVARGVLYYKKSTASSYISVSFSGKSVSIPAGTLESGATYDVYLTATSTNGSTATTSTATLSTVDGTPTVEPVSPNNEVTHGDVTFVWNYSNETGESQRAFDIQTSADGSTWTTILNHVVSSQTSASYTQTSVGKTYWRVRGYNQNDVAGSWSASVQYVNNVPPQPPTILEVIPGGRIQVRWTGDNQIAYRVQVINTANGAIVYDSGDNYGTETLALINEYLTNGNYTIRVRISNIYGRESAWASQQFEQTTELPALAYNIQQQEDGTTITINSEGFEKYYLIRNGELIARFTTPTYTDQYAAGETTYRLIAVNENDYFAQANFTVNVNVAFARIVTQDGQILRVSDRWDAMNSVEQQEDARYSANEYLGATAPEHIFSKMRTKRITRAFYDPERISENMLGTVAFYVDEYGNGDWVAITSRTRSDAWIGDDTKIEMELTTRKERVVYDV